MNFMDLVMKRWLWWKVRMMSSMIIYENSNGDMPFEKNNLWLSNAQICGVFNELYEKVKKLREDCRPLHAEPLHQGAELPRQAVVQKGLSTFRNSSTLEV